MRRILFWTGELRVLQAFHQYQAHQILIPCDPVVNLKMDCKFIFPVFFGEFLFATTWQKL
jgi:hypothetical protein